MSAAPIIPSISECACGVGVTEVGGHIHRGRGYLALRLKILQLQGRAPRWQLPGWICVFQRGHFEHGNAPRCSIGNMISFDV